MGEPFKNQGDCINDGARGLGVVPPSAAGAIACANLTGSSFVPTIGGPPPSLLWLCQYPVPPNPGGPLAALQDACTKDSEDAPDSATGTVAFTPSGGHVTATRVTVPD